jgi:long-chain acyl-CoA synthetase
MMPNVLQNPIAAYGILRAGLVVVNVNPLYTPRELEHQLRDSGAKAIFVLENFARTVEQVLEKTDVRHVVVSSLGEMLGAKGLIVNLLVRKVKKLVPAWSIPQHKTFKQVLGEGEGVALKPPGLVAGDIAFLQYTGGTTGIAKGAMLTHRNLLSNKLQLEIWLKTAFENRQRPEVLNFLCALPLYHIFALTVNSLMGMSLGAHNILVANPRDIPAGTSPRGTASRRHRRWQPPTDSIRPSLPARSACRSPPPISIFATRTAIRWRSARSAKSAFAGHR